jgi:hypothetical protein
MSRYYTLYKAIKAKCPSNFKGGFRTLNSNSLMEYGVFLKGGAPTDRNITSGVHLQRTALVTFNINGDRGVEGILQGYTFAEAVVSALEQTKNEIYTDSKTGEQVHIISVDVIGDVNDLGVNELDIPVFSLNFIIKYQGGNNNG